MPSHPAVTGRLRLEVREALSAAAREINEDGSALLADQIWVIDGASGLTDELLTPGPTDAAWLTTTALAKLHEWPERPLDATVRALVEDLTAELCAAGATAARPPHALPSASLAAISLTGAHLEVLTLGDCRLLLRRAHSPHVYVTASSELDRLDAQAIAELVAAQQRSGGELFAQRPQILATLRRHRDLLNRPGGYRALAVDLDTSNLDIQTLDVGPGTIGLVVSDGLYRLVDTFASHTPAELLDAAQQHGLATLLDDLRALEAADPQGHRFPRLKASDDATAVLFEITDS